LGEKNKDEKQREHEMMQEMHSAASQAWVEMYEVIMLFQ